MFCAFMHLQLHMNMQSQCCTLCHVAQSFGRDLSGIILHLLAIPPRRGGCGSPLVRVVSVL